MKTILELTGDLAKRPKTKEIIIKKLSNAKYVVNQELYICLNHYKKKQFWFNFLQEAKKIKTVWILFVQTTNFCY